MSRASWFTILIALPAMLFGQAQLNCSKRNINQYRLLTSQANTSLSNDLEKYDVHYYFLDVKVPNSYLFISGNGELHATARVSLDSATIQLASGLTVLNVLVNGLSAGYKRTDEVIKVAVNKSANENFVVRIEYEGSPVDGLHYHYFSPTSSVTWNLSEPFNAFQWFPVKQSLLDKADSCDVWITVPITCMAGSNGVLQQVTDMGAGWHRYEWKHRHPIAYYLISLAAGEYEEYSITANPVGSPPVTIQNYIYKDSLSVYQSEMDKTVDFMELFAEKFGPYPFADEKYGHCTAPLGGGMEHQTMTTQDGFNAHLTSHELAHQWWGNQVTCASWKDIWLNEGFASYGEDLMLEYSDSTLRADFMSLRHTHILGLSGGSVYVDDTTNVGRIFDVNLTYNKGSAIIHTLRYLVNNDSLFFEGLNEFQTRFSDSVATGENFIQVMNEVANKNFDSFLSEWYYGEGYPTYSVRWNKVNDSLLVEIVQVTSTPASVSFFTNDLDLLIKRIALPDTIVRVSVNGKRNQYLFDDVALFESVERIDPLNWIVNLDGTIVEDPTFMEIGIFPPEKQVYGYSADPSPTSDVVTLTANTPDKTYFTLLDAQGRILQEQTFYNVLELNLISYASGLYVIKMMDGESVYCKRIVKR